MSTHNKVFISCLFLQRKTVAGEPAASDIGGTELDAGVGSADALVAARQCTPKH